MNRVKPTNDLAFKKVLASEENKDILQGLIADFFEIEVENLSIEHPYSISDYKEILDGADVTRFRQTIKDVSASFEIADFVSELQIRASSFYDERALYYPLDRFCKNFNKSGAMRIDTLGKPNRYSSLRPVYALNILGYNHFPQNYGENALHIFELYDVERQKRYTKDFIKIAFFELTKTQNLTTNQKHWHDYFNTGTADISAPEYIIKACEIIDYTNLAEEEKMVITALEKWEDIRMAEIHQGFLDGKDRQIREFAKLMLKNGESIEKIMLYTGLSEESIQLLCEKA